MALLEFAQRKLVSRHRGTLPLLLACPHNGTGSPPGVPPSNGVSGCGFSDDADLETRAITVQAAERLLELCGQAPYVVMADYHRRHIDANRPREGRCAFEVEAAAPFYEEYHQTLRAFVDEIRAEHGGVGWLIDVHGALVLSQDPAQVYLGTARGLSVRRLLARDPLALFRHRGLRGMLKEAGYVVSPAGPEDPEPAPLAGGFTVRTYGSSHPDGIDALQVEIVDTIRRDEAARPAFVEAFARALALLAQDLLRATHC